MNDFIQLLPDAIANQIAAGEVVQRPASVVKELLENSVDAGAQHIQLIVKDAGKTLIQVVDDGCGMSETDARMTFERHATSKIQEAKDLFAIRTMGFRGEAMASIAAVAQVELRTRRRTSELGTLVKVEASKLISHEPCQQEPGTSVAVKNLFFNVPARRNFLKSDQVEKRHIIDEFQRVAIANPEIFFSLQYNDQEMHHLPPGNLRQRIVGLFNQQVNKKLVPVEEGTDVVKVSGYIGKPEFARKSRGEQFFFVNDRFIKSGYLHHAIMRAFDNLLPDRAHPLYVLFIDIDPSRIDINVHPTKQEIKFDDERMVYQVLQVAVKYAIGQSSISPALDFDSDVNYGNRLRQSSRPDTDQPSGKYNPSAQKSKWDTLDSPNDKSNLQQWQKLYEGLENSQNEEELPEEQQMFTVSSKMGLEDEGSSADNDEMTELSHSLFQLHNTYIVSPIASGFLLIDQKAAHERILYEQNLERLRTGERQVQQKLFPQTVELSAADADLLRQLLEQVNALGFDIQEFGQHTFVVHGTPADYIQDQSEQTLVEKLLEQFRLEVDLDTSNAEKLAGIIASSAAIKSGKRMEPEEMQSLIDRLFACNTPTYSPSGRKCFITIALTELEKRFL